jgi:hypothetical protein
VSARIRLLDTLNGEVAQGEYIDQATGDFPNVVLGSVAAERLGISDVGPAVTVRIGDQWFNVIGILEPFPLAADLDRSVIVGHEAAQNYLDSEDHPSTIHVRTEPEDIDAVRNVVSTTDPDASPPPLADGRTRLGYQDHDGVTAGAPGSSWPCSLRRLKSRSTNLHSICSGVPAFAGNFDRARSPATPNTEQSRTSPRLRGNASRPTSHSPLWASVLDDSAMPTSRTTQQTMSISVRDRRH